MIPTKEVNKNKKDVSLPSVNSSTESILLNKKNNIDYKYLMPIPDVLLGKGAYGEVKLMIDSSNTLYAVKIVTKEELVNRQDKEMVKSEIEIQKGLHHPNIIELISVYEDSDYIKLVLEYAPNGNLFNFIRNSKFLDEMTASHIFYQIVKGVQYLHSNKVLHRDIKPENILMSNGVPKISDFGWSAKLDEGEIRSICGTPEYMAPEIVYNGSYDQKVDVWALGILLYEMLHGHAPFKATCITDIVTVFANNFNINFRHLFHLTRSACVKVTKMFSAAMGWY